MQFDYCTSYRWRRGSVQKDQGRVDGHSTARPPGARPHRSHSRYFTCSAFGRPASPLVCRMRHAGPTPTSDHVHAGTAAGARVGLLQESLPGHLRERRTCQDYETQRGAHSGEQRRSVNYIGYTFIRSSSHSTEKNYRDK